MAGIFDGIKKETNEAQNMLNMDLIFKIALPLFFLGSPAVVDYFEIEGELNQVSADTKQPVELVLQLVRNFKSIPHAITSYRIEKTDLEFNSFGYICANMLDDCHSVHKKFHVLRDKCHSYFTTFLVRPRNIKNNTDLLELETILN